MADNFGFDPNLPYAQGPPGQMPMNFNGQPMNGMVQMDQNGQTMQQMPMMGNPNQAQFAYVPPMAHPVQGFHPNSQPIYVQDPNNVQQQRYADYRAELMAKFLSTRPAPKPNARRTKGRRGPHDPETQAMWEQHRQDTQQHEQWKIAQHARHEQDYRQKQEAMRQEGLRNGTRRERAPPKQGQVVRQQYPQVHQQIVNQQIPPRQQVPPPYIPPGAQRQVQVQPVVQQQQPVQVQQVVQQEVPRCVMVPRKPVPDPCAPPPPKRATYNELFNRINTNDFGPPGEDVYVTEDEPEELGSVLYPKEFEKMRAERKAAEVAAEAGRSEASNSQAVNIVQAVGDSGQMSMANGFQGPIADAQPPIHHAEPKSVTNGFQPPSNANLHPHQAAAQHIPQVSPPQPTPGGQKIHSVQQKAPASILPPASLQPPASISARIVERFSGDKPLQEQKALESILDTLVDPKYEMMLSQSTPRPAATPAQHQMLDGHGPGSQMPPPDTPRRRVLQSATPAPLDHLNGHGPGSQMPQAATPASVQHHLHNGMGPRSQMGPPATPRLRALQAATPMHQAYPPRTPAPVPHQLLNGHGPGSQVPFQPGTPMHQMPQAMTPAPVPHQLINGMRPGSHMPPPGTPMHQVPQPATPAHHQLLNGQGPRSHMPPPGTPMHQMPQAMTTAPVPHHLLNGMGPGSHMPPPDTPYNQFPPPATPGNAALLMHGPRSVFDHGQQGSGLQMQYDPISGMPINPQIIMSPAFNRASMQRPLPPGTPIMRPDHPMFHAVPQLDMPPPHGAPPPGPPRANRNDQLHWDKIFLHEQLKIERGRNMDLKALLRERDGRIVELEAALKEEKSRNQPAIPPAAPMVDTLPSIEANNQDNGLPRSSEVQQVDPDEALFILPSSGVLLPENLVQPTMPMPQAVPGPSNCRFHPYNGHPHQVLPHVQKRRSTVKKAPRAAPQALPAGHRPTHFRSFAEAIKVHSEKFPEGYFERKFLEMHHRKGYTSLGYDLDLTKFLFNPHNPDRASRCQKVTARYLHLKTLLRKIVAKEYHSRVDKPTDLEKIKWQDISDTLLAVQLDQHAAGLIWWEPRVSKETKK